MVAKVEWVARRKKWYVVDRNPSHPSGRWTRVLGPSDADREMGEQIAAAINAERYQKLTRAMVLDSRGPLLGEHLIRGWWDVAEAGLADSTRATNQHLLPLLLEHFGQHDLRRLSAEDVKGFGGKLADSGLGQHRVHNALSLLRRALHWALEQEILQKMPVRRICELGVRAAAARGATRGERQAWTREEAAILLELCARAPRLHAVVFAALQSGARKGELLALRWEQVSLTERRITWSESRSREGGHVKPTKANRGRTVDLSPQLAGLLEQLARDSAFRESPDGEDFVFRDARGKPWNHWGLDSAWDRLRVRARVRGVRPLPFHSWRHTYVSWALASGEDLAWIARQIGDRIDTMTRNYAHLLAGKSSTHDFLSLTDPAQPARSPQLSARAADAQREQAAG